MPSVIEKAERWRPVPGWRYYEVSSHGRARSLDRITRNGRHRRGCILSPTWDGYWGVSLYTGDGSVKRIHIHRLVLSAFVGACPQGMQGCHSDDDRENNRLSNLHWGTPKANVAEAFRNKKRRPARGVDHVWARLTDRSVRAMRLSATPARELARRLGVSRATVQDARARRTWKHVL